MIQIVDVLRDHMYVVVISVISLAVLANSLIRSFTSVLTTQNRERSRREIAAYIAEGTLSPEQGERLMQADIRSGRSQA